MEDQNLNSSGFQCTNGFTMTVLHDFFIKDQLNGTSDPGEKAKILLSFRFSLFYLILTVLSFPLPLIYKRLDILYFMVVLTIINITAMACLKFCKNYRNTAFFIAAYALISAVGNSLLASSNMSIIIFIWPVIVSIFISFVLGSRATFIFILLFAISVIGISVIRILELVPVNPLDEKRVFYSTTLMMIMASIFLSYFLRIYDQSRNEAISAKLTSLESKDNILHVVAHDLRNALSGSYSVIPVFKESLEERNFEECSSYLEIVSQSTTSSLAIVNEILESATLFTETKDIVFVTESVNRIVQEITQQYRPAAAKKRISLSFEQCQPDCFFKVNVSMINRILGNLLSNAIKFTRHGGTIEIRASVQNEKIVLRVKDNGIGIPPDLLPKIFNKYTAAGRKGTNGESSTGLGMYIVQNLLALHKAAIRVESQENVGTTFIVEFPKAK